MDPFFVGKDKRRPTEVPYGTDDAMVSPAKDSRAGVVIPQTRDGCAVYGFKIIGVKDFSIRQVASKFFHFNSPFLNFILVFGGRSTALAVDQAHITPPKN